MMYDVETMPLALPSKSVKKWDGRFGKWIYCGVPLGTCLEADEI